MVLITAIMEAIPAAADDVTVLSAIYRINADYRNDGAMTSQAAAVAAAIAINIFRSRYGVPAIIDWTLIQSLTRTLRARCPVEYQYI